jgi:hypothetical protein
MKKLSWSLLFFACSLTVAAQDIDLDKLLEQETKKEAAGKKPEEVIATFKTTRISNGHSVETLPAGVLDFKIQHRFGTFTSGIDEFFGLDQAFIRLGLDYGINDRLMVGLGRTSYQKQVDGFLKYKLLKQKHGGTPVTVTALASAMYRTDNFDEGLPYTINQTDRLAYAFQLMVARKFSEGVSLQLMPTLVHYNIVPKSTDPNVIISIGAGGRFKLTKRTSFNIEYYYNLSDYKFEGTRNSLAVGFDIETGGHVFQLIFTNGQGIAEKPFITETTGDFFNGDIHFGFNISRVFQIGGKKKGR